LAFRPPPAASPTRSLRTAHFRASLTSLFRRREALYLPSMPPAVASLVDRIVPVLERYGVRRAGVFGSYARGEADSDSDLDLLVDLPSGSSLLDLVGLQLELRDALGIDVDANTYRAIHPMLRDAILADEIRIL